uniref:Glycosyl transferase family 1 domain-containing protein n=1 Tax=Neobodo designis TaxID=312471 RepID=A0A7S1QYX7_NEODS
MVVSELVRDRDMPWLYRSADAFVLTSRGEGWGLPVAQAVATAMPVISTRCGGLAEFVGATDVLTVDSTMVAIPPKAAKSYDAAPDAKWCEPALADIVRHMRTVHRMPPAQRAALGRRGRDALVARFSISAVGQLTAALVADAAAAVRDRWRGNGSQLLRP